MPMPPPFGEMPVTPPAACASAPAAPAAALPLTEPISRPGEPSDGDEVVISDAVVGETPDASIAPSDEVEDEEAVPWCPVTLWPMCER